MSGKHAWLLLYLKGDTSSLFQSYKFPFAPEGDAAFIFQVCSLYKYPGKDILELSVCAYKTYRKVSNPWEMVCQSVLHQTAMA